MSSDNVSTVKVRMQQSKMCPKLKLPGARSKSCQIMEICEIVMESIGKHQSSLLRV